MIFLNDFYLERKDEQIVMLELICEFFISFFFCIDRPLCSANDKLTVSIFGKDEDLKKKKKLNEDECHQ